MGFIGRLRRKDLVPMGSFFFIFMIGVLAAFLPSCGRNQEAGLEVISKRVKLDLPDTAGEQRPKIELKPAVENMPDVKADLPVKEVVKPDTAKPAIKVEIPEKKEPEVVKDKKAALDLRVKEKDIVNPAIVSSPGSDKKSEKHTNTAENIKTGRVNKTVYKKSVLKKAKLKPWAVNVASFPSDAEVKKLISALKSSGYNGYTTEFTKNAMKWHRVRVGFYRTREEALKAGRRIEARFHVNSAWVVKPATGETLEHIK